jgi:hypothetical protein
MTIPLLILCLSFTLFLLLGVPVAFSIGLSALATLLYEGLPLAVGFQQMTSGMNIFSFLAIPFFIFAGELMLYGGIADRIVNLARDLVGHVRGGLGMSNVVACTLFGGVSGSPVADVSAMGAVMIPMMKKEGYHADYAVNVTTHAALVGALMPTSAQPHHLFAGGRRQGVDRGADPGGAAAGGRAHHQQPGRRLLVAVKRGYPAGSFPGWGSWRARSRRRLPGLFIVIILGGILSGVFTATESAAMAVIYALLLTIFVYRTLKWEHFIKAASKACEDHRRDPAADRHLQHLRLPHQPVRRGRAHGPDAVAGDEHAVGDLPADQRHPVRAGHLPGHGRHHPAVHAHLPAHCPALRHDPVQFGIVMLHQLRAGPEYAAGGHDAVRRLRHRRRVGGHGDANDLAVLRGIDLCAGGCHIRACVLDLAAQPVHGREVKRKSASPEEPTMTETTRPPHRIRIHADDNVAIVANDGGLKAGTQFSDGLVLVDNVPQGHKVALADLAEGDAIAATTW